jgi:hypothetical protein
MDHDKEDHPVAERVWELEPEPQPTATDKFLEAAAHKLNLCQQDGHWSTKVSGWLMPSNGCGCCLAWRGLAVGGLLGAVSSAWVIFFVIYILPKL